MPGSQTTVGMEELQETLKALDENTERIAKRALYVGARVVADAYERAVDSIRTAPRRWHDELGGRLPTPAEKEALKIGIARFRGNTAEIDTLIGVANGYTVINGRQKAMKLIARSINSGTSFMHKQPVFRKAESTSRRPGQEAVIAEAERLIDEITK